MAEIPRIPETATLNEERKGVETRALALAVSAQTRNILGVGREKTDHRREVEKASRNVDDHFAAQLVGAKDPDPLVETPRVLKPTAESIPDVDVKVTRALRKAAVLAIGDAIPNAKEIVDELAAETSGGAYLDWVAKNGAIATAALKDLPTDGDAATLVATLNRAKAERTTQKIAEQGKDVVNTQEKVAAILTKDGEKDRKTAKETADAAETDAMLKRLETLNPSFAQRANAEYERYADEQKTANAERAAQGQPAAEPLDRRAYVVGAYVAAMSTGAFIGGVAESDRAEAAALVARLHESNREGVARFLRDVAPGTNHAMLANAVAAHAKAAGVDVNTDGAELAGERMEDGKLVKLAKKGDTTVESWPDGKTVYRATDGRRVEADDGTITSYAPDGRRISRTNEGNPSICYLGDIALPLSIAGKSPDDIIHAADAVAQWEGFFKRSGFGFLTATDWQAIERAVTNAGAGSTGALAFADSHVPLERDEVEDVATDLEKLAGFKKGDLFNRLGGFALKTIPGHPFADPTAILRDRFHTGWIGPDGQRVAGPAAGGRPDVGRMMDLMRHRDDDKERHTDDTHLAQ